MPEPEPWMRGPLEGVPPLLQPVLFALQQAREDLYAWTEGLTVEQLWTRSLGLPSVGFQVRHIAGSMDRLLTYARGEGLSERQLTTLKAEAEPGAERAELLARLEDSLLAVENFVRMVDVERLTEPRAVGRQRLPTTLIGLLVHIAEHSQRHVGQAITTVKVVREMSR